MHVLVMGTGGVGGYFGAHLARAGHQISFIARGQHLNAINRHGLTIESAIEQPFTIDAIATETIPMLTVDMVLFTVKSADTIRAIELVRPAVSPNTLILTLQNGVDSIDQLAASFTPNQVLGGVAYLEVAISKPGTISQKGGPRRIIFGELDGVISDRCERLLKHFLKAGWLAELSGNIKRDLWSKLAFIAPFAGANTVTGLTAQALRESPETRSLIQSAMSEVVAVANSEHANMMEDAVERATATLDAFPPLGLSSMYRDRLAGRPLELEALIGTVIQRGERHNVSTPTLHTLHSLLAPMAAGNALPAQ
jgi:2-dehydropantoate 2-reductase